MRLGSRGLKAKRRASPPSGPVGAQGVVFAASTGALHNAGRKAAKASSKVRGHFSFIIPINGGGCPRGCCEQTGPLTSCYRFSRPHGLWCYSQPHYRQHAVADLAKVRPRVALGSKKQGWPESGQ